ncbi:putative Myosin, essential light chain [Hypsibius exemplaris]|uniref:Myosin, essential light chain n=1 Tax=Hypsibius exemplaris TaxID=2072580 RepID=A0A1W0X601_HYPEX|nr:putative Myosin, essential light chain [Hypsibius exemplaris]
MFFGEDGKVDALKTPDILRSLKFTPTIKAVNRMTGCEKKITLEEFLPIYAQLSEDKDVGTYADFMEAMLVFDEESNGTIIAAELRHLLLSPGEKMKEDEVGEIIKLCSNEDTEGNTKYEDFIKKVLEGPFPNENND